MHFPILSLILETTITYGTGDLLVNISIYVPEALNKEEKSTLEKMEASDNFKPNTSVKEKIFKKFKSFFD